MSRRGLWLLWGAVVLVLVLLGLLLPPPPWKGAGEGKAREPDYAHPAISSETQGCTGVTP